MARRDLFIDSSGLFALLCPTDPSHGKAVEVLKQAEQERRMVLLSDYILDETATLFIFRKVPHLARELFNILDRSEAVRIAQINPARFEEAKGLFLKHLERGFSFTDCSSFALLNELEITEVLTTDRHFRDMGFQALLVG